MRVAIFCEAKADFETTATLLDRLLCERATWVTDLLPHHPEAVRRWVHDSAGRPFFDLHNWLEEARSRGIRTRRGRFGATPARPGAVMARHVFLLATHEHATDPIDAVVLVWDADGKAEERDPGVKQAIQEATETPMPFTIVFGLADRMREAWILAGFEPETPAEQAALRAETKALGFAPNREPHRLQDSTKGELRHAKRALEALTAGDPLRESRCLTEPPLEALRSRGEGSGLRAFLDELDTRVVVPFVTSRPAAS